jgi:hypothetical protein
MSITDTPDLLEILDAIRCGDATREQDLPPIAGECWDGIADLVAEPPRGYRDPMNEGWLRTAVELIWADQEVIAHWDAHGDAHDLLTRYGGNGDPKHGHAAAEWLVQHCKAEAESIARQILAHVPAWSPARYRACAGTRLTLVSA